MLNPTAQQTARKFAKHFITALRQSVLSSLLLVLALSPALQAQNRNTTRKVSDETILTEPLQRTDPRAQLDPQLLNAQPLPPVDEAQNLTGEAALVEYNVATGQEKRTAGENATLQKEALPSSGFAGLRQLAETNEVSAAQAPSENVSCLDTKQAIHNTHQYPWSAQVKLFMTFPNGGHYVGSGTLINSKYVITHQNNVYYPAFGGFPTRIEVVPGLDGNYKPFGSAFATYFRYWYHGAANVGLLTLDRHIGLSTGWFGYGSFTDTKIEAHAGNVAGYKTTSDAGRVLYYGAGRTDARSYDRVSVGVLFMPGELGAGNYLIDTGGRYVFGVSASAQYFADASNPQYCSTNTDRITSWISTQIQTAINSGS